MDWSGVRWWGTDRVPIKKDRATWPKRPQSLPGGPGADSGGHVPCPRLDQTWTRNGPRLGRNGLSARTSVPMRQPVGAPPMSVRTKSDWPGPFAPRRWRCPQLCRWSQRVGGQIYWAFWAQDDSNGAMVHLRHGPAERTGVGQLDFASAPNAHDASSPSPLFLLFLMGERINSDSTAGLVLHAHTTETRPCSGDPCLHRSAKMACARRRMR